jgi:hypothetical protein
VSGATVAEFLAYWEKEGESYVRRGDYAWMASLVPGKRVLEIGCGVGYATQALLARGLEVLALDTLPECLQLTQERCAGSATLQTMLAEVSALSDEQRARIEAFAPDTVVCWLMGAPAETTGATPIDAGRAVVGYREKVHRAVAQLAASLSSVQALHLVDRTAIHWQAKDIGRDTLVGYHNSKTLLDLPLAGIRADALYRRLEESVVDIGQHRKSHPSLKSVVPTLASLLAKRRK